MSRGMTTGPTLITLFWRVGPGVPSRDYWPDPPESNFMRVGPVVKKRGYLARPSMNIVLRVGPGVPLRDYWPDPQSVTHYRVGPGGVYPGICLLPIPPYVHPPTTPGTPTIPTTLVYTQHYAEAPWVGREGALGSRRLKPMGERSFCASERRKYLPSYASARRNLCSRREDRMKDWIATGETLAQAALGRDVRAERAHP